MSHIRIDLEHVSFAYEQGRNVIDDITLHVGEQDSVGLIGANGMGKSTLLKLLVGLHLNYEGTIRVEEIPVQKETLSLIREKIGYVFQDADHQLFMSSAYEDVAFAPRNYGIPETEVKQRVSQAFEMTGSTYLQNKPIYKMSGGEKKLVSIATILSMVPDIILMDEPSIALDPKNRRNLIGILNRFKHMKILASHDLDLILETCNRTILISEGRIVREGTTRDLLTNKELLEQYGLELPYCLQGPPAGVL